MLFTNAAKDAIAKTFYDKQINVISSETTLDSEGGIIRTGETTKSSFYGNVRYTIAKEVQSEIGLTKDFDIAITCSNDTSINLNDMIEYNETKFIITDKIPSDSHLLLVGIKWQA